MKKTRKRTPTYKQFHFHLAVHSKTTLIILFRFFFPLLFVFSSPRANRTAAKSLGKQGTELSPARILLHSPRQVLNCTNLTFTICKEPAANAPIVTLRFPPVSGALSDLYFRNTVLHNLEGTSGVRVPSLP